MDDVKPVSPEIETLGMQPEFVVLLREYLSSLSADEANLLRLDASALGYLDRIVILAGGALTLVFTVVANLSTQLHLLHVSALHPWLITVICWLFVSCIVFGLISSALTLDIQRKQSALKTLSAADSAFKLRIMEKYPNADPSKIPMLSDIVKDQLETKRRMSVLRIISYASQASLFLAFVFLAMFVQANLGVLLTAK